MTNRSNWAAMSVQSVPLCFGVAIVFGLLFASRPLWHTDLWDHINYGKHILKSGVPATEPLLQTAEGTPFVSTAWLSQTGMALISDLPALGLPGLQFAHALLVAISCLAIGFIVLHRKQSGAFAVLAGGVFLAVNWQQLIIIRPQLVGVACYCATLAAIQTHSIHRTTAKIFLGIVFLLWANCHGSFAMGLTLIAMTGFGKFCDVLLKTRSLSASFKASCWKPIAISLLACSAIALINPFGFRIYGEVLRVGQHPNIKTMFEWDSMTLQMKQGQAMAFATVSLLGLLCFSPRRMRLQELLPLVVTGCLAVWSARMVNWYAPLVAVSIGIHGAAIFRNHKFLGCNATHVRRKSWTAVNIGIAAFAFAGSSLGTQTIFGKLHEPQKLLSAATPVNVTRFLASPEPQPNGLTFVSAEWAGYIMHQTEGRVRPFVNLHVHVIPPEVWEEYIRMLAVADGWENRLACHSINTVVVDKNRQPYLIRRLNQLQTFDCVYADQQAAVYFRKRSVDR